METTESLANKAIVMRMLDAANTRDLRVISDVLDAVVDPDVRNSTPLPVAATGVEGLKQVWAMLLRAMPDVHLTIEDLVAEGNTVVARNLVVGTHRGEFMGLPGTGTPLSYDEIFIFRFVNGRIAQIAGIVDGVSQMRQLGILPTPHPTKSLAEE